MWRCADPKTIKTLGFLRVSININPLGSPLGPVRPLDLNRRERGAERTRDWETANGRELTRMRPGQGQARENSLGRWQMNRGEQNRKKPEEAGIRGKFSLSTINGKRDGHDWIEKQFL